jgi:hypothetical protein
MRDFSEVGRSLMVIGGVLFLVGLMVALGAKVPALGRLPGDFVYRKGNFTLYVPIATCLALSLLLTLLLSLFRR